MNRICLQPHETWDGFEYGTINNPRERNDIEECTIANLNGETTVDEITIETPTMHHICGRTLDRVLRRQESG